MENQTNETQDKMQIFFAEEKQKTLKRYKMLNKIARKGKILFTGSSLMEQFPLNEMLMTNNIRLTAYNRGIGGFTTDDMLAHMEEMVFGTEPSIIFINIGTNDIGSKGYKLEHLITNYEKIIHQIQERLENVTIYMIAYYPINDSPEVAVLDWVKNVLKTRSIENITKANNAVKALAKKNGCHYIDLNNELTDHSGRLKKEFCVEGIHMYPNGYQVVFNNLLPYLQELQKVR